MAATSKRAREAIAAMQDLYDRVVAGDWEGYKARLAPDYVSVGPDGAPKNRDRTVEDWQRAANVLSLKVEPVVARAAGEVVFVYAKYECVDERKGETRETEGSLFEVWHPGEAGWRCLATHFTESVRGS